MKRQLPLEPVAAEEVEEEYELVTLLACDNCDYFEFKPHDREVVYERKGKCPKCKGRLLVEGVFRTDADPSAFPSYDDVRNVERALKDAGYEVKEFRVREDGSMVFHYGRKGDARRLARELAEMEFTAEPEGKAGRLVVQRFEVPEKEPTWLALLGFSVPVFAYLGGWLAFGSIWAAVEFALAFSSIYLGKEIVKVWVAKVEGLRPRLPLFLVVPPFPGAFSSVIRSEVRPMLIESLCRVGVAGLTAGFLLSTAVFLLGAVFDHTPVRMLVWHNPWTLFLSRELGIVANPITLAGWAGLAITWLSALPVYPLEGGYILRYYYDTRTVKWFSVASAFIQGWLHWYHIAVATVIILIKITAKLPSDRSFLDDDESKSWLPALLLVALFILLVSPAPFGLWFLKYPKVPHNLQWVFLK
ncbi:hypothetical protein [Methanopyrus sp.]